MSKRWMILSLALMTMAVTATAESPELTVREDYLGEEVFTESFHQANDDVGGELVLRFRWLGWAESYGETVESYRWGWDLADPDDPMEPGWAVEPGLESEHKETTPRSFTSGIHVLTIDCRDSAGQLTRARWVITVVPVPDPSMQRPLLLVDDVMDHGIHSWGDEFGNPQTDDHYRDAFWAAVLDPVQGWDPLHDIVDTIDDIGFGYRNIVEYRAVLWATAQNPNSLFMSVVGMTNGGMGWLDWYQRRAGNLMLVGGLGDFDIKMYSHQPLLRPIFLESALGVLVCGNTLVHQSLGITEDLDGSLVPLGPMSYPYRTFGLSIMDQVRDELDLSCVGDIELPGRRMKCTGAKGIVIDPDYRVANGVVPDLPDTIMTNWIDVDDGVLESGWSYALNDEAYDWNGSHREYSWSAQTMPDGSPVIEVMLRSMPRYDWILSNSPVFWPDFDPSDVCGEGAFLDPVGPGIATPSAMNGSPIGILSYKTTPTKPSGRPDILWGFDPHRFDHGAMAQLIRWTLASQFGLAVDGLVGNEPDPEPLPELTITALHPARPNPFNPSTTVSFDLAAPGPVSLNVMDVRGRHVATLVNEALPVGGHTAVWTGRDDDGRAMPAGVYFVRMIAGEARETTRVVLLK